MSDFFEDLEKAEQERDLYEYELNNAYNQGWNDAIKEFIRAIELKYLGVHPDELYEHHYAYDIVDDIKKISKIMKKVYKTGRKDVIKEIKEKMISFHTNEMLRYGADIIEARSDAFDDLKCWIKEQLKGR